MNRSASFPSILDRIVETKRAEVARLAPERARLRAAAESAQVAADFAAALTAGPHVSVIAEVKRRSPSAGEIRAASAPDVARVYEAAGASCISVLTDAEYFGGSLVDLEAVAGVVSLPLLRKDFTIDEVQVYEAAAHGASAVLLIARILDDARLTAYCALASELRIAPLVEVHDEWEAERAVEAGARIIGVNNRDLATFTTDLTLTARLGALIPHECTLVGESGVHSAEDVTLLAAAGVSAVLVGEALMRAEDAGVLLRAMAAVPRIPRS